MLSSAMVSLSNVFFLFLPAPPFSAHFWLLFMFYTSVPLLVFIAIEEDCYRVVETFGYHILLSLASVDTNKDKV